MSAGMVLPWQVEPWRTLTSRLDQGRLPHALLLTGPAGLGKNRFALELVRTVLCQDAARHPCGQCAACLQFAAGSHPDHFYVTLAEDRQSISVDQIRELAANLALTSLHGGWKTAIITPAERMNANAANGLLKTLEEPPARSLLVLVTDRPARLPATVRSRCQTVAFTPPARDVAEAWLVKQEGSRGDWRILLELAGGAPFAAIELVRSGLAERRGAMAKQLTALLEGRADPSAVAKEWLDGGAAAALRWFSTWIMDLIRIRQLGRMARLQNADLIGTLQTAAQGLHLVSLHRYLDAVRRAIALLDTPVNPQLQLEALLVAWSEKLAEEALQPLYDEQAGIA